VPYPASSTRSTDPDLVIAAGSLSPAFCDVIKAGATRMRCHCVSKMDSWSV